ncbi:MAG: hypothetical protein VCC99_04605 [Alphaproteobacteria bacterium]
MESGFDKQAPTLVSRGSVTVISSFGIPSPIHEVTYLGEIFTLLQETLAGLEAHGPTNAKAVRLDLHTYTAQSISGILVDPYDGKRYELRLRPATANPDNR